MDARQFDDIIRQYLKRVRDRLYDLPESDRSEIIGDLQVHIDDAIRESGATTEADVRNVLERIGDPETLAREARERVISYQPQTPPPAPVYRRIKTGPGALELVAIILTALAWPIGLILAWISSRWRTRDKVIATAVPVMAFVLMIAFLMPVGVFGMRAVHSLSHNQPVAMPAQPPQVGDVPARIVESSRGTSFLGIPRPLTEAVLSIIATLTFVLGLIGAPVLSALYLAIRVQPAEETFYPDGTRTERELSTNGAL